MLPKETSTTVANESDLLSMITFGTARSVSAEARVLVVAPLGLDAPTRLAVVVVVVVVVAARLVDLRLKAFKTYSQSLNSINVYICFLLHHLPGRGGRRCVRSFTHSLIGYHRAPPLRWMDEWMDEAGVPPRFDTWTTIPQFVRRYTTFKQTNPTRGAGEIRSSKTFTKVFAVRASIRVSGRARARGSTHSFQNTTVVDPSVRLCESTNQLSSSSSSR